MAEDIEALSRIGLFDGLPEPELGRIAGQCRWRSCAAHQQIIDRHSESRDVFFVVDGTVRVVNYAASGREVSFDDIGAGGWFGELAAIDGGPRSASVVALTDTRLCALPPSVFTRLVTENPVLAQRLMVRLTQMIRHATGRIFDLSVLGAHNRVQAEILRLARPHLRADGGAVLRPVPVHADIASRVSTTRETVARVLGELARQGVVRRERGALVIVDVAALSRMVEEFEGV